MTIKFHTHAIIVDKEGNEVQRVRLPNVRTFMFDYLRRYVTDLNYQMSTNEVSTNLFEKIWSYDCEVQRVRLPNVRTFMFDYLRRYVTDLNYQMSTNEVSTNLFEKIWSYDCELLRLNLYQLKHDYEYFKSHIMEREVFELPELGYDYDGIRTAREEIVEVIDEIIQTMKDHV